MHLVLGVSALDESGPAGFCQQGVDLELARLSLRPVEGLRRDRLGRLLLRRSDLCPQIRQVGTQLLGRARQLLRPPERQRALVGLFFETFFKLLALAQRCPLGFARVKQSVRVEPQRQTGLRYSAVGEREPETELEQRRDDLDRLQPRWGLRLVDGPVPRPLDLPSHVEDPTAFQRLERSLVQQRVERVVVGRRKGRVVQVHPLDG